MASPGVSAQPHGALAAGAACPLPSCKAQHAWVAEEELARQEGCRGCSSDQRERPCERSPLERVESLLKS